MTRASATAPNISRRKMEGPGTAPTAERERLNYPPGIFFELSISRLLVFVANNNSVGACTEKRKKFLPSLVGQESSRLMGLCIGCLGQ